MTLYFENSRGVKRVIANPENRDNAWKEIYKFCEDRKFKILYQVYNTRLKGKQDDSNNRTGNKMLSSNRSNRTRKNR
jgi:hypothetical protein